MKTALLVEDSRLVRTLVEDLAIAALESQNCLKSDLFIFEIARYGCHLLNG